MDSYDYLIVGAGMAGASAIAGIRSVDAAGSIGLVGSEPEPPYARPPLSKGLWKDATLESVWMDTGDAALLLGRRVEALRPAEHGVLLEDGSRLGYGRLLLATGASPKPLRLGDAPVHYLRSLRDYRELRDLCETSRRFLVIGGGFIGAEIAAALSLNGKEVVLALRGGGICARFLPGPLSDFLGRQYRDKGIGLRSSEGIVSMRKRGSGIVALMDSGEELEADSVVIGIGALPNTALARDSGLLADGGRGAPELRVAPDLRVGADVFAAGDAASYYCGALGKWIRVEHEDNALAMGLAAGRSMAGAEEAYDRIPYFYTDLFDIGFEAVGEPDSRMETVVDWVRPFENGVVYYLSEGRVRGVLLWNLRKKIRAARALVAEAGPFATGDLMGRIR
jgi:NADPH-dependent 2,4-dienoyl-CoA reductase/sulfur reductase-like enzyme